MGKKVLTQSDESIGANNLKVSENISKLCEKVGLIMTDECAVLRDIIKKGVKDSYDAYTRWAKDCYGECYLVVFDMSNGSMEVFADYKLRLISARAILIKD